MANDMYTDLLRQTREEIARRGTQELEKERNRRQAQFARNAANSGIRGAYGVLSFENGAEIQERNRANRYISEYRDLQNAYGQSGTEADESILQQMKQLNQKYGFSGIQDAENKLEGLEAGKWMEDRNQLYSNLESNPDFEQYSKPSSTTPTAGFGIQFGKHWLGKGDAKYDYINNLGGAQELAAEARGQEDNVNPYGMYDLMEPEEVARYNYLYHTQGEKAADEYLDYLEYTLSERGARKVQQVHTALAEGHPILANGLSVFSKLQSGVGLLDVAAQKAGNSIASALTGEEQKPIDYYRASAPSIATSAIRGTTAQQIADKTGVIHFDEKEHPVLSRVLNGKGLADVYQLGMSMVDSLAAGKLAPGIGKAGTVLLGGSAGTQGMLDAVEKGATDDQAIMMGLLNGAAEIVFETYEVENLLGSSSNILKSVLNQALTEAIGEGATTISNNLADILVMQDKSEFMTKIREYQNQGMSKEKAELQAFLDAAIAVGWDSFGGALSGGLFGLAGPNVSGANDTNQNGNTTRSSDFTIEEGTESGPVIRTSDTGNEAQKAAQAPQEAQTQQTSPVQAAKSEAAAGSATLSGALEYYKENGRVSNSLAEKVLADPAAVQELQERTGVTIPGTMEGATHTQKRNAVKSAIAQLAGERPGLSRQGAVDTFVDSIQELREENNGTEAAPEQAGGAPPAELDAAISQALRGESPGNSVDSVQPGQYNNKRSDQVSGVIDRLNRGGTDSPSIDEIMAIPEIAEAEKSNDGTETINLPDREQIRNAGYQQAMQKGSWNGTDYSGPVRQERRMDIVIGLPGSGKSSVYTERLSQQYGSRVIDTDDFREYIPEYNGSNASVVHEEASEIRDRVFEAALDKGDNVLLSTIGANANKLEGQIARYRQLGYSVYLHLNELPNSKSIARAIGRYISEDGSLGRYVSPKLIEAYGDKPAQTYLYLTGQGGTENGGLGSDLRTGRGQSSENAGQNAGTQEGSAAGGGEGLLAGYDWYNNDVARGERPRLVQSSEQNPGIKGTGAAERNFSGEADYQELLPVVGGQQSDTAKSRTYTNPGSQNGKRVQMAYKNVLAENPEAGDYQVKHQADTLETAQGRVSTPEKAQAEYQNLMGKEVWDADDVATANLLQDRILRSGDPGAANKFADLAAKKQETLTQMGQAINAAQIKERGMKNAETTATAVDSFISSINSMEQSSTTYNAKKAGKDFADWKKDLCAEATRIGIAIESLEGGDAAGMREIIRQIAAKRKTTANFGSSDQLTANARRILNKLDFDTLKKIANTQIAAMPDDFRRRSVKEVAIGIRKNNVLSSIKTFRRNIGGNLATGVFDPFSEGTSGRIADLLLSKFTEVKTIGNEFNQAGTWIRSARDAADFSALCVELDIPIETDADASFAAASSGNRGGKYVGKTFRPTGNPAIRFMYAYQKYMSYALEVSDKIFEGGAKAAVTQSLQNMDFPGLEDADVQRIAAYTANRRTFKDATFTDSDGKTKGAHLSRAAQAMKRGAGNYFGAAGEIAGDIVMPFASVPMNVQQTGIDYTAGTVKAVAEIAGIIRDVKAGKQIDPVRQRNAASDFGRGVTGIGMVALFTAAAATGVLRVSNAKDKDEKALAQAEGRMGAQLNWNAMLRGLKGESTGWKTGDAISSLDFLEPFNTQMYLGYELAQDDSVKDMAKAFPTAAFNSVLNSINDSPMMTGLAEIGDLISDVVDAESMTDKVYEVGGYLGDVASSYIPQFVRQTAQYSDGYYRDTRGENALEYAANKIKAAIPGLSKTLPVKYSGLGEPQKRGGFLETFVDPTATHVYHKNEVTGFLEELKEKTGVSSFIPDRQAPMSIRVDGDTVNLDGTARETYQKTYGELVNSYYLGLMNSQTFRNMPEEAQVEALIKAESYAKEHAKSAVSEYNTDKPKDAQAVTGEIIRSIVLSDFSEAFSDLTGGTAGATEALGRAYDGYNGLPQDDREIFLENATGRVKWMIDAGAAGMDAETFAEMYQQYRDIDGTDKSVSQKANAWSYALQAAYERGDITKKQMQTLKKDMVFRYSGVVDTPKFDSMVEAGISGGDAKKVVDLLAGLKPESGYKSVRDIQNAEAIVNSGLSNGDTVEALYAYLPSAQDENLREMLDMGFSAQDYVDAWRLYDSESGEGKKRRTIENYRSMFGVDYETAKMIYEIYG